MSAPGRRTFVGRTDVAVITIYGCRGRAHSANTHGGGGVDQAVAHGVRTYGDNWLVFAAIGKCAVADVVSADIVVVAVFLTATATDACAAGVVNRTRIAVTARNAVIERPGMAVQSVVTDQAVVS
jgi:hypothetical protein